MTESEFDEATEVAWREFQARLGDYLSEMIEGDHLILELPETDGPGCSPYAQFAHFGDDQVRAELSGNGVVAAPYVVDDAGVAALLDAGWNEPDDDTPNFFVEAGTVDMDRIAVLVVSGLRETFGTMHPAMLTAGAWGPSEPEVSELGIPLQGEESLTPYTPVDPDDLEISTPRDRDELRQVVERTLEAHLGQPAEVDSDEDFVVPNGTWPVYVRVRKDLPVIEVFTVAVRAVHGKRRAALEASLLTRDNPMLKFVLYDEDVYAFMHLPAWPFVPQHLLAMLPMYVDTLDRVLGDLALRTGGVRP